eukprot:7628095-Alexandrium_andersonii.AAC.1
MGCVRCGQLRGVSSQGTAAFEGCVFTVSIRFELFRPVSLSFFSGKATAPDTPEKRLQHVPEALVG